VYPARCCCCVLLPLFYARDVYTVVVVDLFFRDVMRLLIHDDALQSAHFNGPAIFLYQDALLIALAFVIAIEWEIATRFCLLPAIISSSAE
jgi:hypothetical protein